MITLAKVVALLRAALHTHRWSGSLWNYYYCEMEQQCRCGAVRHHLTAHEYSEGIWHEGPHPKRPKA